MPEATFKTFASDQEVRWCPGCGDYAILRSIQKVLAKIQARPENTVFVSGIGCAARTPYYLNTYGFHGIHGRAPAIATGLKLANPELNVWVITGDGDGLSIGGNHLLHVLRRNVDLNVLLFNNEIYGLTKGQHSPTSRINTQSPSSPSGSFDNPISPGLFASGARATFIARALDVDQQGLQEVLVAAHEHRGASFVEILQNCIVYNKDVFGNVAARATAAEHQLRVRHGQPLCFGAEGHKGVGLNQASMRLEITTVKNDFLVHDETNPVLAHALLDLGREAPLALGVIHRRSAPTFDQEFQAKENSGAKIPMQQLLRQGHLVRRPIR